MSSRKERDRSSNNTTFAGWDSAATYSSIFFWMFFLQKKCKFVSISLNIKSYIFLHSRNWFVSAVLECLHAQFYAWTFSGSFFWNQKKHQSQNRITIIGVCPIPKKSFHRCQNFATIMAGLHSWKISAISRRVHALPSKHSPKAEGHWDVLRQNQFSGLLVVALWALRIKRSRWKRWKRFSLAFWKTRGCQHTRRSSGIFLILYCTFLFDTNL